MCIRDRPEAAPAGGWVIAADNGFAEAPELRCGSGDAPAAAAVEPDGLFLDPAFPPGPESLTGPPPGHRPERELPADCWMRAPALLRSSMPADEALELFAHVEPSDITQALSRDLR